MSLKNNEDLILILGSRGDVKLPNLNFKKIYSANGAAILVDVYKKKFPNIFHTNIFGFHEFQKNYTVQKNIINSKPDEVFIRNFDKSGFEVNFFKKENIHYISSSEDRKIQMKYVNFSSPRFLLTELKYEEKFFLKIKHFYNCFRNNFFQGLSSGLFSLLIAIEKNPNCKIIISGIGLEEGGGHFYTSEKHKGFYSNYLKKNKSDNLSENRFRNTSRKRVERELFKHLNEDVKKRIYAIDDEFCKDAKVEKFEVKNFF